MVKIYTCPRCGFHTHIKTHFKRHLHRKIPCENISGGYEIEYLREQLKQGNNELFFKPTDESESKMNPKMNPNESKMNPIDPQMTPNESKMNPNESKMNPIKKIYKCKYCFNTYSTNSNMCKHMKKCKHKPEDEDTSSEDIPVNTEKSNMSSRETIQELKKQLAEKEKIIREKDQEIYDLIPQIGDTYNLLVNFGNEKLDHVNMQKLIDMFKQKGAYGGFPLLLKNMYHSKDAPQNNTVYIPNISRSKMSVHVGDNKWALRNKDEVVDDIVDHALCEAKGVNLENYDEMMEKYHNNDKDTVKRLKNDAYNVFLEKHYNDKREKEQKKTIEPNT